MSLIFLRSFSTETHQPPVERQSNWRRWGRTCRERFGEWHGNFHSLLIILFFTTQTLSTLNLDSNQIGNAGAQYLAGALRNNTVIPIIFHLSHYHLFLYIQTLKTLLLSSNKIGDEGAQHIADGLKNNTVIAIFSSFLH